MTTNENSTTLKTETVRFTDGGFAVICREFCPFGFTNHRVEVRPLSSGGWVRKAVKAFEPDLALQDLHAVRADLTFMTALANPFLAKCAKEALTLI